MQNTLIKPSLLHLPLEPYKERYTEFLADWERKSFGTRFDVSSVVPPQNSGVLLDIQTGSVLDSTARPVWSMQQVIELINRSGALPLGQIYTSDFYTPGLDALAYSGRNFRISSFCWAQTFDRFDFSTKMIPWMRPWEVMAFNIYDYVFVACPLLKELIVTALPEVEEKVRVVGLPFNSEYVASKMDKSYEVGEQIDCVYTSRWDKEKNPGFFLDVVASCPNQSFAICTGANEIRGNDRASIMRLTAMREAGQKNLQVFTGLDKGKYYAILAQSHVQFNSASQDWISFTLLEALAFGCTPLYPNYRSFPEALFYSSNHLYPPFDLDACVDKLRYLLGEPRGFPNAVDVLDYHDHALNNIADVLSR